LGFVEEAYDACERAVRAHYENFPVASLLLPAGMRRHVAALYAFARAADDFADEGSLPAGQRLQLLDGWQRRLHEAAQSASPGAPPRPGEPAETPNIFLALGESIRSLSLPVQYFDALLSAFRQDVTVTRYRTWDDMMQYCQRSANPVGRLVLRIAGYDNANLDAASDAMCAALQLTNFWQDLKIDFDRGRIYLPEDERERYGALERDLATGNITVGWQRALSTAAARTRLLFDEGRHVCDGVRGRLRYELRATWLGGVRILDRLERSRFDVIGRRPRLGVFDALLIAPLVLAWRPTAALP
jgi:phytoene synthase